MMWNYTFLKYVFFLLMVSAHWVRNTFFLYIRDHLFWAVSGASLPGINPKTAPICLDHKEKLNFGQIYLADRKANNFTIVACYASNKNQQIYLRLIDFDELFKKVSMIFNFSNNYDVMIINRYEQALYTSHNKHINNLDLNNITSLKKGLAKIMRYNTKFYSDTQGFNFKNYYSLTTFRDNNFKIFIKQMALSEEQEFYKFLTYNDSC